MSLTDPFLVVAFPEALDGLLEIGHRGEAAWPQERLFHGPDEAFGATVALRPLQLCRAGLDPQEADFLLVGMGDELTAVVVPKLETLTFGDLRFKAVETAPDRLAQGLPSLRAGASTCCANTQALRGAVVDHEEDGHHPLARLRPRGMGSLHLVRMSREDGSVIVLRSPLVPRRERHLQASFRHDFPDPPSRHPDSLVAQAGPDLAVALPDPERLGQDHADVGFQFYIAVTGTPRAPLGWELALVSVLPALVVDRGTGDPQNPAHPEQALGIQGEGRGGLAHRLGLHQGGGRLASRRSIFSFNSLISMVSSPTLPLSRVFSSSRETVGSSSRHLGLPRGSQPACGPACLQSRPTPGEERLAPRPEAFEAPPPSCVGCSSSPGLCAWLQKLRLASGLPPLLAHWPSCPSSSWTPPGQDILPHLSTQGNRAPAQGPSGFRGGTSMTQCLGLTPLLGE